MSFEGFDGSPFDIYYFSSTTVSTTLSYTSSSHPFATLGTSYIEFTPPTDWVKTTVSGTEAYYILLQGANSTQFVDIDQLSLRSANLPTTTISSVLAQQTGTGSVSLSFSVGDNDFDSSTRLKFEYEETSDCKADVTATGTINSDMTFGFNSLAISVDNGDDNGYQINGIDTSSGGESITSQWDSATEVPNADGTYCVYFTPNDGTYDGLTVSTTVTLDNVDPTNPGAIALSSTSTTSVVVTLPTNATSTDTNFSSYKIYYKAGSSGVGVLDNSVDSFTDVNLGDASFNGASTSSIGTGFALALATNTQYVADIYAEDSYGNAVSSTAEITFYTAAATPASVSATANSSTQITVSWDDQGNPTGTLYYVVDANDDSSNSGWTSSTQASFTGLTASTEYTFKVKARNGDEAETAYSGTAAATTDAAAQEESNDNDNNNNDGSGFTAPAAFAAPPVVTAEVIAEVEGDGDGAEAPAAAAQVQAVFSGAGRSVRFAVGADAHRLLLNDVRGDRAFFTVFSEPKTFDLAEGEDTTIDLDNDGRVDIHVEATRVVEASDDAAVRVTVVDEMPVLINNNDEQTAIRDVDVRMKAIDGVTQVAVSEDETFTGVGYTPYTESVRYRLSEGAGEKTVYVRLRKANGAVATVSDSIMLTGSGTDACPLVVGKAYKTTDASSVYMVTDAHAADGTVRDAQCTKRAFTNADVYFTYFDSWDDVIEDDTIGTLTDDALGFMPWGPQYDPQYGALVKVVSDAKVYLLLGEEKFWITSEDVFTALGYAWSWIEDVDVRLLDDYTAREEITATAVHPNYTLVKYADGPEVYRLEPDSVNAGKTVKRYIPNESVFEALTYRWDRIVTIPATEQYEDGEPLSDV